MGFLDDIEQEYEKMNRPKWKILQEEAGEEIAKMLEYDIPIKKQVELILKNGILEKLDRKEYHNILVKHFGYKNKNTAPAATFTSAKKSVAPVQQKEKRKGTAEDKLSQSVDLMAHYLEQEAARI